MADTQPSPTPIIPKAHLKKRERRNALKVLETTSRHPQPLQVRRVQTQVPGETETASQEDGGRSYKSKKS